MNTHRCIGIYRKTWMAMSQTINSGYLSNGGYTHAEAQFPPLQNEDNN